jgi:hypothetical protein
VPDWGYTYAIFGVVWAAFFAGAAYRARVRRGKGTLVDPGAAARRVAMARLVAMGFPVEDVHRLVEASASDDASDIVRAVIARLVTG